MTIAIMTQTKQEAKPKPSFFQRLFGSNNEPSPPPPPPYIDAKVQPQPQTHIQTQPQLQTQSTEKDKRKINATAIPQWEWSNQQCKEWLTSVLIEYANLSETDAESKAEGFKGFRPMLFTNNTKMWTRILGADISSSVFSLIYNRKDKPGALPKGITYAHYQIGYSKKEGK